MREEYHLYAIQAILEELRRKRSRHSVSELEETLKVELELLKEDHWG